MKTLKTSKKDKEGFAQPRGETLRKGFTGNISIFLDDAFHQSTRHKNNDLGEERRRILDYLEMDRQTSRHAGWEVILKVFVGVDRSRKFFSLSERLDIFHKPHQRTNRCQNIYTPPSVSLNLTKAIAYAIVNCTVLSEEIKHV